jgi:vacuolar-type H+-ATPase subunit I/STV1
MADEEIRIDITVEDAQAKEKINTLRQTMETFKGFAKEFAKETGDTLEVAFSKLKDVGLGKLESQLKTLKDELKKLKSADKDIIDKAAIKETEQAIIRVTQRIKTLREASVKGLSESKKEARDYVRVLNNLSKIDLDAPTKEIKEQGDAIEEVSDEAKQAQGGVQGLVNRFKDLGAVGQIITTVFGIGIIQAIRELIDLFKEAITASFVVCRG